MQHSGFTLIEIVITIAVIAILTMVVLIPVLGNRRAIGGNTASLNCGRAIQNAQALHSSRSGSFATSMEELATMNVALLDACAWQDPNTPYAVTGDDSADTSFTFTVSHATGDTSYRITPTAITALASP